MLRAKVEALSMSNAGFVVLIRSQADPRTLPVFIGATEAQSIALQLEGTQLPRPLTHDLLKNVLDSLDCALLRVEITDLVESTFYARIYLEHDGIKMTVDSRPSDAIALALRYGAPIFVAEKVMERAGVMLTEETNEKGETTARVTQHAPAAEPPHPPHRNPVEALQRELHLAIKQERFEDAARLRDAIRKTEEHSTHN